MDQFAAMALALPRPHEGILRASGGGGEGAHGNPWIEDSDDQGLQRHGLRVLEIATPYLDIKQDEDKDTLRTRYATVAEQGVRLNELLAAANDHGSFLETGRLGLKGDERYQVGTYVRMPGSRARCYVEGVVHHFRQGSGPGDGTFRTHLDVARGRGHIVRAVGGQP